MKNKYIDVGRYKKLVLLYVQRLSDPRYAGQVGFAVVVLLITWSGVKAVETNYGLQKQISGLRQQNQVAELENQNTKLQNQYYQSDQYKELAARQGFNMAAPGEKMVVVPKEVALKYTVDVPTSDVSTPLPQQPAYVRHLQAWVNFFLHRQQAGN